MKHFVTLLTLLLFSQMAQAQKNEPTFETLWKQVEKLENEALTTSALKLVSGISEKAKKEKNSAQIVKALLYASKYAMTLEENAQLKIINDFKTEIKKAKSPTKNVLESYLATLFWQYFQQNRHQFYNRTKTAVKIDSIDFRTWDLTTLFTEISIHFDASLKNETSLQNTPVSDFKVVLNQRTNSEEYRPTLFDLLAHNALAFYKTSENSISRPIAKFEINDPKLLCDGDAFVRININTPDETSLQTKALRIYQTLLLLHGSSKAPYTYAEINIERLNFIYQNAVFKNKEQQFQDVLQNSASATKENLASGLYQYEIALLLRSQGQQYQANTNEKNRWKTKEALTLCESVIKEHPDSKGAKQCKALRSQILQKSLQLTTEKHIPIQKTGRFLVNYLNLNGLTLSARSITELELKGLNEVYEKEDKLAFIKKLPPTIEWQTDLKNENDYQSHRTEISMPPLANGRYLILAEPKDKTNKTFSFSTVQVTDMALSETRGSTEHNFQVIDRHNGKPISGALVVIRYKKNYARNFFSKRFVADSMGNISIPLNEDSWRAMKVTISHKKDKASYEGFYRNSIRKESDSKTSYSCFLFTDRSIYRPSQPLYFKGITIQQENDVSSILGNEKVSVQLKDVNGQVVATKAFTSNDYGSFSGEFKIPNNGLTGQFSLQVVSKKDLSGYARFSVEEYKRPKFETSFKPVTESYKVNDSVRVKGSATAYAGSSITDAKVAYRVKRVVYYPRWCYQYYPNLRSSSQEIAHGETKSDASGVYQIDFKALADNSVDRNNRPTFSYEVTADVTDINGETHSASTIINVGYHTLTATIDIANSFDKDSEENKLSISTTNLNGQFVAAKGSIKMYKLKAPKSVNRPRPWAAPDYEAWSKNKFKKTYPNDAFANEHDASTWEKGELVWASNFDTEKSKELSLGATQKWLSGKYSIELNTKDKFDQPVKDILQTTLFGHNDTGLADNQLFDIKTDKTSYAIGDQVKVTLLSNAEDINVTVNIEKDHTIIDTKLIHLSNSSASFTVPVNADDLGGFAITYSYSVYNYFYASNLIIQVPYPATDLQIETMTFRDKLQPAMEETWSFKIKGPKGDKVTAELLANMYDASLDTFRAHYWGFSPLARRTYHTNRTANAYYCYGTNTFQTYMYNDLFRYQNQNFDSFQWFGLQFGYGGRYGSGIRRSARMMTKGAATSSPEASEIMMNDMELDESTVGQVAAIAMAENTVFPTYSENDKDTTRPEIKQGSASDHIKIRQNLQENAFFFPHLKTDKEGNVSFSFTTPEALTKWNVQLLAHNKHLESSIKTLQTVTQKELMVTPNTPRFLREGDEIVISTKIANLTNKELSGTAKLALVDAVTGKSISKQLVLPLPFSEDVARREGTDQAPFKVDSLGNTQVSWRLKIPTEIQAIQYTVTAKAGDFSDGEQNVLPVLTNRILLTETLPMWVQSNQTKTFTLDKLKTTKSATLKHHKLTLEMTSNPAWYAVQALPYLMEYPYECNEQTFSKYYANTLAAHIANRNPKIQEVFTQWANSDALVSNLEKNQELKSLLIQETPWLRDAQSESEQKKRIALLFNLSNMKNEQTAALNKLKQNQKSSGAWPWFNGGPDNRFITQYISTGFGHLKQLNVEASEAEIQPLILDAIHYLDAEFVKEYEYMKKHTKDINADHLSQMQIHFLYMRSFFKDIKTSNKIDKIITYYSGQAQKYWKDKGLYAKGMLALIMHRMKDETTSKKILQALQENSITSDELGMYWKENGNSWLWYQAPIETQSLLIEVFSEITPSAIETIDKLKIWLLKHKQTNQWKTTKATSEAVYALLLQGSEWLSVSDAVDVLVGGEKIEASKLENAKTEAGTGYYKTAWNGTEVAPKMAEVQVSKKGKGIAWGALYWQYFEDLDKITSAETPLKLKKKLFLKKNTDTGEEISAITANTNLKVGDLVRVRIELSVDRPMEFVHMKDMRAAGFEPINIISRYKWQDGLGYYESTKDASTNFFFDYLPKGTYVFEYDLRINNAGNFSNGITSIQSMYAPEFSSHSEGVRVKAN